MTSASGAEAAGGLEMTADPGIAARNADEAIIIEADASDELAADDRPITAVGGPELVQVTRPIPASIKRKMMLRLVEAIFTTSEAEEAKPAISEQTADAIKTVRAFDNAQVAWIISSTHFHLKTQLIKRGRCYRRPTAAPSIRFFVQLSHPLESDALLWLIALIMYIRDKTMRDQSLSIF